jgi:glycosyltransferase involved in cell wall biosynthesis
MAHKKKSDNLRVAQFLYSGLGGHGSVVFSLLNADIHKQWHPLLGFVGIEPVSAPYINTCVANGVAYKYFEATVGKPWRTWLSIVQWLNSCRPDTILIHSVSLLLPCLLHSYLRGIPLVAIEHQANALKHRREWVFSYLAMLLADKVVLLTPSYKQELKERLGWWFRESKVQVIPNGIDTVRFKPQSRLVNRGELSIRMGMASRFIPGKRQDVLVAMMTELRQREPSIDWQLSLAGDGASRACIEKMVKKSNLDDCINLPGQLDEPELINWYQSLDIYIHASEGETLSTAILQAMASGLPIVASDVPGIRSLIAAEVECGLLADQQTPAHFAKLVIQLSNDALVRSLLGSVGRQLAASTYSQDEMFAGYTALLNAAD